MPMLLFPGASSCVNSHKWKELRLNTDNTGTTRLSYTLANNKKQCLPRLIPMPSVSRQEFVLLMIQLRGSSRNPGPCSLIEVLSLLSQARFIQDKRRGAVKVLRMEQMTVPLGITRNYRQHQTDLHLIGLAEPSPSLATPSQALIFSAHLTLTVTQSCFVPASELSPGQNKQLTVNFPEHFQLCFLIYKPPYKEIS